MNDPLPEGTVFADRYRVVRRIAMGGMGAVYEAVHLETGRRRALKTMHPHLFQSEELRERFKLEARIAASIESENIVDVSDAGVDPATSTPFIVMELLRGEELSRRLKQAGRLSHAETVTYLRQMAMALDRTHAASIVHRDLKPENVFLCARDDGSILVKILDFGVAKLVADGVASGTATMSVGTPLYMAPEQFRSSVVLTPAADVYALGLLAYTMLVGEPYWKQARRDASDPIAFALVAAQGPRQSPLLRAAQLGVALPPGFEAWFARVTGVDPNDRPHPASAVVEALAAVLGVPPLGAAMASASRTPAEVTRASLSEGTGTAAATTMATAERGPRGRGPMVVALGVVALAVAAGVAFVVRAGGGGPLQAAPPEVPASATEEARPPAGPSAAAPSSATTPAGAPPASSAAPPRAASTSERPSKAPRAVPPPRPASKPAPLLGRD